MPCYVHSAVTICFKQKKFTSRTEHDACKDGNKFSLTILKGPKGKIARDLGYLFLILWWSQFRHKVLFAKRWTKLTATVFPLLSREAKAWVVLQGWLGDSKHVLWLKELSMCKNLRYSTIFVATQCTVFLWFLKLLF